MVNRFLSIPVLLLLAFAFIATPALGQGGALESNTTREYRIPAGPLGRTLATIAAQSNLALSFDPGLTDGKLAVAVIGRYTVREAAGLALAGRSLEIVPASDGTYTLRKATANPEQTTNPSQTHPDANPQNTPRDLGRIRVEAVEETDSYAATDVSIGGKTARDPKDIQQSVSVLTAQRIREQNITDVPAAMAQTTGITLVANESRSANIPSLFSRGFQITSLQFDGGSPAFLSLFPSFGLPDLATYDRVEVLRGSDGLFSGAGEAGGTINVVRKKPLAYARMELDASAGTWNRYRAQIDATGPLGWDARLRGRAVIAYEDREFFYDVAKQNKTVLYGVLEANPAEGTLITFGGSYEKRDEVPFSSGIPRQADGSDLRLPRHTCFCTAWGKWEESTPDLFAKVEQSLGANWSLRLNVSQQRKRIDTKYVEAFAFAPIDPPTYGGELYGNGERGVLQQRLADVTLNGRFNVLGREQDLLIGTSWQDFDYDGLTYLSLDSIYAPINILDFDRAAIPDPGTPAIPFIIYNEGGQKQTGAYATLRSQITDGLHSVIGLRYSNYRYKLRADFFDTVTGDPTFNQNQNYKESDVVTPYAGLTYAISNAVNVYVSYSEIFKPQGNTFSQTLDALDPITGASYELGAKGAWLDDTLTASLAVYSVRRKNEAVLDFESPTIPGCCYTSSAEIRSRGLDAEVNGQLRPGWQLFAGYTYNVNHYEFGYGDNDGSSYMPRTPKHLMKVWTMVTLPGEWSKLRVGGGVNAQSKSFITGTTGSGPYRATQDGYALFSLRGEWKIDDRWSAALNVNNLFDKTYYQSIASPFNGSAYGEPRNAIFTVHAQF